MESLMGYEKLSVHEVEGHCDPGCTEQERRWTERVGRCRTYGGGPRESGEKSRRSGLPAVSFGPLSPGALTPYLWPPHGKPTSSNLNILDDIYRAEPQAVRRCGAGATHRTACIQQSRRVG